MNARQIRAAHFWAVSLWLLVFGICWVLDVPAGFRFPAFALIVVGVALAIDGGRAKARRK